LGVISTSDVLEAEAEAGDADQRATVLEETLVTDLMTPRAITVSPDTDVQEAARQMLYADVKRLFVERDGELVGVISQTDIVTAVANGRL
ncbi:MAG TPA: CBS domain-containing protein, partial [Gemmatimonadales bacterium]|nr:CBS domain-containing protein [Gemmatimonadales bacterium]